MQEALSEARSSAAKWQQERALQTAAKETLQAEVSAHKSNEWSNECIVIIAECIVTIAGSDQVSALKSEAKELTDAHSREVERLHEKLGGHEQTHDSLDVRLAEEVSCDLGDWRV